MKKKRWNRLISTVLAAVMLVTAPAVMVYAEGEESSGKYVSDVFIAYGKNQKEAESWLINNGWEPIKGDNDFCAGKNSIWDDSITAAMGIKRTNKVKDAITDMAVMNMTGGYSVPMYEQILEQKRADIDELIYRLMDMINEFRDNYNGKGSEFGAARAKMVADILNRFYDGEVNGEFAVHDTGLPLGDLLLAPMRHETGGASGGDLNQILLESSGRAMLTVEVMLALAADTNETTWLERLSALSEESIAENIGEYVPSAAGQNLPPSAISNLLMQEFGSFAEELKAEWRGVNEKLGWFDDYNRRNDLWQKEGEEDAAHAERVSAHFASQREVYPEYPEAYFVNLAKEYEYDGILYAALYDVPYAGSWGETLGDFFHPAWDVSYDFSRETSSFLPMAAALSRGQRASLDFLSLSSLIMTGLQDEEALELLKPDLDALFNDNLTLSIYLGVNRDIFRNGVAITNEAMMEQNMGKANAFDKLWDTSGIVAISAYCGIALGALALIAGTALVVKENQLASTLPQFFSVEESQEKINMLGEWVKTLNQQEVLTEVDKELLSEYELGMRTEEMYQRNYYNAVKAGSAANILLGVGGALLLLSATVEAVALIKYYQRTFTPIPRMMVSESDIITYLTDENGKPLLDENGNQKKLIEFNQFEYYTAVKCNRPEVGRISDWQDGVSEYQEHGCYDIADLNGDFGQEWLALYTVKSPTKSKPILADSLKLQYGSDTQPRGTWKCLHFFEYTYPMDIGDTAYSFNNDKHGIYFFWDYDDNAADYWTASIFTAGHLAMAGAGGLILGVLGATLVLLAKRKKEEE